MIDHLVYEDLWVPDRAALSRNFLVIPTYLLLPQIFLFSIPVFWKYPEIEL
jgi:hypothetical protein